MADLITVSVASMLNTSRATAASAMLRVSQEENLRGAEISFGANWWGAGISFWRKLVVGTRNDCAQYFEIEINKSSFLPRSGPHTFSPVPGDGGETTRIFSASSLSTAAHTLQFECKQVQWIDIAIMT